jgi:hypothetical protein
MQSSHSSQHCTHQPGHNNSAVRDTNSKNGQSSIVVCGAPRPDPFIRDFNNPLVRRAYKATINSNHIELQTVLLNVERTGVFFAREVFDELLAVAVNYKDKNAIGPIAQAAIRESVQSADVLRFQEILFQLCDGRPETTEGRANLKLACTIEALYGADEVLLTALLRYKIVPSWDVSDCSNFEIICATISMGGPVPEIVRPTLQGLAWVRAVCADGTEHEPDRVQLIAGRFDSLLRACEQRGGEPRKLAILYRGVGSIGQLAKMCVNEAAAPM